MSNEFEYQSNCLINVSIKSELSEEEDMEDVSEDIETVKDNRGNEEVVNTEEETQSTAKPKNNIKSELNEEENTEDMSEDIDKERDEQMNMETVVNSEDKTKIIPKRDINRIIKVVKLPNDSGQTEKQKSSPMFLVFDTESKQFKTPDGVFTDSGQTSDQNGDKQSVEVVTASSHSQPFGPILKCIVLGCSTLCLDQMTLNRHLELDHKIVINVPQTRLTSIEPKCVTPVITAVPTPVPTAMSTPKVTSRPAVMSTPAVRSTPSGSRHAKPDTSHLTDVKQFIDDRKELKKKYLLEDTSLGQGCGVERQTKEVILNLNQFFKDMFPSEPQIIINELIESATKISVSTVKRTLNEFKTTGKLKEVLKTKKREPFKYKYNDEDRDILSNAVYKLRDENRLTGCYSVYNEIRTSQEFNPTFKKCGFRTFIDIFKRFGFKIGRNRIWDIKPSDSESERTACQRTKDSTSEKYLCDWPGCQKQFNNREHLIMHLRTHTNVKPFACRYPKCDYRCAVYGNFTKHLKCHNKTEFPNEDFDESELI